MRRTLLIFPIVIFLVLANFPVASNAWVAGTGISDCAGLLNIDSGDNTDSFYLMNDIDCNDITAAPLSFEGGYAGTFDGNGYTISDYTMETQGSGIDNGLFDFINGGTIKDVNIEQISIDTEGPAGILAGGTTDATISNVHVSGDVFTNYVGAGGLIGQAGSTTITNSSSTGSVDGGFIVGGLIGSLATTDGDTSEVLYSWSESDVIAHDVNSVGGLIGQALAIGEDAQANITVANTYATGDVTAGVSDDVGGLIGRAQASASNFGATIEIDNSYSSGAVTGGSDVGGLIGQARNINSSNVDITISDSFSASAVSAAGGAEAGFIGLATMSDHAIISFNNIFGTATTGQSICVSNHQPFTGCTGYTDSGPDVNHFKGTSAVEPMASWGFSFSPWQVADADYPVFNYDDDGDGIQTDGEQDGTPGDGDFNGDTIFDGGQNNVVSFALGPNIFAILTDGAPLRNVGITVPDPDGYVLDKPALHFLIDVDEGDSANVDLYFKTDTPASDLVPIKISESGEATEVTNATLADTTVDGVDMVRVSYLLTDGGINDNDNEENGFIIDPIALATPAAVVTPTTAPSTTQIIAAPNTATGNLASTGTDSTNLAVVGALCLIVGAGALFASRKKLGRK